jgi:hypothetical protein
MLFRCEFQVLVNCMESGKTEGPLYSSLPSSNKSKTNKGSFCMCVCMHVHTCLSV